MDLVRKTMLLVFIEWHEVLALLEETRPIDQHEKNRKGHQQKIDDE